MTITDDLVVAELDGVADADEPAPTLDPAHEVEALTAADRHLESILLIRHERSVLDKVYRDAFDRLNQRYRKHMERLNRREAWHTAPLRSLHAALLDLNPRRKSVSLPHGTLKSRQATKPSIEVTDADAFVVWAVNAGVDDELVHVKRSPNRKAIADQLATSTSIVPSEDGLVEFEHRVVVDANGEVVPGVTWEPAERSYTVDTTPDRPIEGAAA